MRAFAVTVASAVIVLAWPASAMALDGPSPTCNQGSCVGWFSGAGVPVAVSWSAPAGASLTDCHFETITADTSGTNVSCGAYYAAQQQTVTVTVTVRRDTTPPQVTSVSPGRAPDVERLVQPRRRVDVRRLRRNLRDRVMRCPDLFRPGQRLRDRRRGVPRRRRQHERTRRLLRSSTTPRRRRPARRSREARMRTVGTRSRSPSPSRAATRPRGSRHARPPLPTPGRTRQPRASSATARTPPAIAPLRRHRFPTTRRRRASTPCRTGRPTRTAGIPSRSRSASRAPTRARASLRARPDPLRKTRQRRRQDHRYVS